MVLMHLNGSSFHINLRGGHEGNGRGQESHKSVAKIKDLSQFGI